MSEPAQIRTVASSNRTDQQISDLIAKISAQPESANAVSRQHTLDILDDLAEEMIGRRRPEDVLIKDQIRAQCDRLRGRVD